MKNKNFFFQKEIGFEIEKSKFFFFYWKMLLHGKSEIKWQIKSSSYYLEGKFWWLSGEIPYFSPKKFNSLENNCWKRISEHLQVWNRIIEYSLKQVFSSIEGKNKEISENNYLKVLIVCFFI